MRASSIFGPKTETHPLLPLPLSIVAVKPSPAHPMTPTRVPPFSLLPLLNLLRRPAPQAGDVDNKINVDHTTDPCSVAGSFWILFKIHMHLESGREPADCPAVVGTHPSPAKQPTGRL